MGGFFDFEFPVYLRAHSTSAFVYFWREMFRIHFLLFCLVVFPTWSFKLVNSLDASLVGVAVSACFNHNNHPVNQYIHSTRVEACSASMSWARSIRFATKCVRALGPMPGTCRSVGFARSFFGLVGPCPALTIRAARLPAHSLPLRGEDALAQLQNKINHHMHVSDAIKFEVVRMCSFFSTNNTGHLNNR